MATVVSPRRLGGRRAGTGHRVAQFDGLRAIAVIAVMAYHLHGTWGIGGLFGVDLFFVLSGFLITGVLVGERRTRGAISLGGFYLRRLLRLYPALVLLCLALTPWGTQLVPDGTFGAWLEAVGIALSYSLSIVLIFDGSWAAQMGALGPVWTLSVEELFYLLWAPALALVLTRVRDLGRLAIAVGIVAAALLSLFVLLWDPDGAGIDLYFRPGPRFGELLLGAAVGLWLAHRDGRPLARTADRLLGLATLATLVVLWWVRRTYPDIYGQTGNPLEAIPIVAVCAAVLVARLATSERSTLSRVLRLPPLPWIGRISYGLYLWHLPVFTLVDGTVLRLAVTFAAASLSYYVVEQPFLRLKNRMRRTPVAGLELAEAPGRSPTG
jgi:peptidoglycan/LPS O-acetylase OafA/YrhL